MVPMGGTGGDLLASSNRLRQMRGQAAAPSRIWGRPILGWLTAISATSARGRCLTVETSGPGVTILLLSIVPVLERFMMEVPVVTGESSATTGWNGAEHGVSMAQWECRDLRLRWFKRRHADKVVLITPRKRPI